MGRHAGALSVFIMEKAKQNELALHDDVEEIQRTRGHGKLGNSNTNLAEIRTKKF